ncbi:MAG: hypothetical protein ACJAYF_001508 [Arenicella sp.]
MLTDKSKIPPDNPDSSSPVITTIEGCDPNAIADEVLQSSQPLLLKGLVSQWPIVKAASVSNRNVADYILKFDRGAPVTVYQGAAEIDGRIFYNENLDGFNFQRTRQTFKDTIDKIFAADQDLQAETYYIGSTMVEHWLPGFLAENQLSTGLNEPLVSIWMGNKSRIAAHYDFPNNIACSVAGRRRFTLFAPEQIDNLYVGPIDLTPSGQPISMVDFKNPDYVAHPKFKHALETALVVELEPGDAILIPSMWWHHVEALDFFNVLVNFWWRTTPVYMGSPFAALQHAVLSLRALPDEQRQAWQALFERYIFDQSDDQFSHIPKHARGVLNQVDEKSAQNIRKQLIRLLKQ